MERIDDRTVEFTTAEAECKEWFESYLDLGHGIPFAAKLALQRMKRKALAPPTDEFIKYLSDDTIYRWGSGYRYRPGFNPWQSL